MGLSVAEASLQLGVTSPQVKRPNPEIFDVVRKICPKEDIAKASRSQWFHGRVVTIKVWATTNSLKNSLNVLIKSYKYANMLQ
jgi:hypothetical protein